MLHRRKNVLRKRGLGRVNDLIDEKSEIYFPLRLGSKQSFNTGDSRAFDRVVAEEVL